MLSDCSKTYAWSDPQFISSHYSASFVPRSKSEGEETVIMPNVFDMRQPLPLSIKKNKVLKMWQIMLEQDDEEGDGKDDEDTAKLQKFLMSVMPQEW